MFRWFGKNKHRGDVRVFDDNDAAFQHACESLSYECRLEAVIPALVMERGKPGPDGERCYLLRLAAPRSCREIWGCTLKEADRFPAPGDLVGFRIVRIATELPEGMGIIGYIAMKFDPVLVDGTLWKVAENYTPEGIKKTVRW